MNCVKTHTKRRKNVRKEVLQVELPYQMRSLRLHNPQGGGNCEMDQSLPTLPWPRRPAQELTDRREEKRNQSCDPQF